MQKAGILAMTASIAGFTEYGPDSSSFVWLAWLQAKFEVAMPFSFLAVCPRCSQQ